MDRRTLSRIDEELDSSEVAALCFLCRDAVNKKRLEGIADAKGLFLRLEEKGLLDNHFFLSQLLLTIRRADLLSLLETDSMQIEETDAYPVLSNYRVMLYKIYEDLTQENLDKMKFLLSDKLGGRKTEMCSTALDVFAEMEKTNLLSCTHLDELNAVLRELDQQLALMVNNYMRGVTQQPETTVPSHVSMDYQMVNNTSQRTQASLPVFETQPRGSNVYTDAETVNRPSSVSDQAEYYDMSHNPHGVCVVINNEKFQGAELKNRAGTHQDEKALSNTFSQLGFTMMVHHNLTAEAMRQALKELSKRNFLNDDALVICVLSHGENGCVFGTDEQQVSLQELTQPFTSGRAPTLAGKPKLFFIQACQGSGYQRGSVPCPPTLRQEGRSRESRLEEDAGPVYSETVPEGADFLLGMATVPQCKSFRNTSKGSIYIQELCFQLMKSARSPDVDDILAVLTRVNREVSRGEYLNFKQMPEPKYTLTKRLVLKCVGADQVQR